MTIEQVLEDCAYDTELKTTERVTKQVTEQVTNDITREFVFRMIDRKYSDEEICDLAKISEDQLTAYKAEYDKLKSE